MGLFNKIKNAFSKDKEVVKYDEGLSKTRREFATELSNLSRKYKNIDEDYFEKLSGSFSIFFNRAATVPSALTR